VAAGSAVRGSDQLASPRAPCSEDATDRLCGEVGSVGQHDDRSLDVVAEGCEPAAKRCARPTLPVRAAYEPDASWLGATKRELVRAFHDDDLVDRRFRESREDVAEEEPLLRCPEPARLTCGEDDGGDHRVTAVTRRTTTVRVGVPSGSEGSPKVPISRTTAIPLTTRPTTA